MARTTKPFDLSGKWLLDMDPAAFAALAGIAVPAGAEVVVVDADLSDVMATGDKLVRIGSGPDAVLINFEFQSRPDRYLPDRALLYMALARVRHRLPVRTVVILYRPEAAAGVTGRLTEGTWLAFAYDVVRLWEVPAEQLLAGPLATVPWAPVAGVAAGQVRAVLDRAKARLLAELPLDRANVYGAVTGLLLGLYFDEDQVEAMMGSFAEMLEDSSVYKSLMRRGRVEGKVEGVAEGKAEGRVEGRQDTLLQLATDAFGEPTAAVVARVRATTASDALDRLTRRLRTAAGWDAWLADD